ncbi:uncharacterized protein LOC108898564 isoform X2 [Lates calcarifer]|uniref:Uncharacterized protein LOC108898564 isoform X2 n=1 Tax=Lates calcarifer TaxID=8187 RepID=A0AAJ7QEH6_LATCA|nr:uncharacterized protein LOC108898564 isoform X2 [Lates calcarifer]
MQKAFIILLIIWNSSTFASGKKDDQGLYSCGNCYQDTCNYDKPTVVRVKKEIQKEIIETSYVTAGSDFTHECPGEFTNLKWTFEASNMTAVRISAVRSKTEFVTSSKSIRIVNVRGADAGKYTCWTSSCDGHKHKLLTVNLCVITAHQSGDSSCAVICDVEFTNIKSNNTANEETGTRSISVHGYPYGSLNCSEKQIFDVYSAVNSTHIPSSTSNKTTGTPTEPEYLTTVIYGTSAVLAFFILTALIIFFIRGRLRADFSDRRSGCDNDGRLEEETSVIYTSVIIKRPAKTTNYHKSYTDCVYSEINV